MDNLYSRSENIDELIRSVKLPYVAWKVLFLVTQNTEAGQVADILQSEATEVEGALSLLEEAGLVFSVSGQTEVVREELVTEVPDESPEEETEVAEETEENALFEEVPESEPQAEPDVEEVMEETITELAEETVEVPEDSDEEIGGFDLLTETSEQESDSSEEEEIAIEIPMEEEDKDISEDLDFDVDIEAAIEEPAAEPVPEPPAATEETGDTEGHKTILVIDDSLVIRKMVEIALEDEDFIIETAVSGKEGLDKLDSASPALVILDMMLPDINGIEILKTIKASKGIPVIMLSGKDSPQMVENAKKEGAEEFLPKPFKDDDLVEKVKLLVQ